MYSETMYSNENLKRFAETLCSWTNEQVDEEGKMEIWMVRVYDYPGSRLEIILSELHKRELHDAAKRVCTSQ